MCRNINRNFMQVRLFTLVLFLISTTLYAQRTFERIDSIPKTKEEIFSDTKLFISTHWKSLSLIQNEDRETGLISVNSSVVVNECYVYTFTVNFYMKDKKYKVVIGSIQPQKRICNGTTQYSPDICDGCPFPGSFKAAVYEKVWIKIQEDFASEMNGILNSYNEYLRKSPSEW